jgi:Uncharacterized conserved protein
MNKLTKSLILAFVLIMLLPTGIAAIAPYSTYTYAAGGGYVLESPDAYVPDIIATSGTMGLASPFDDPRDIEVDPDGNVYIVDAVNSRVICLDRYMKNRFSISTFVNEQGVPDGLSGPSGVFINDTYIYVCDTEKNRIVMFDREGVFVKIVPRPVSSLFAEGSIYKPVAVAVDQYGRLFVVSSTTYQGIIVMSDTGDFQGFIGAMKVTISPIEILWRRLQTQEQRDYSEEYVSTEFNNITIDKDGFIYVTTSSIPEGEQQSAIRDRSGDKAPVKKLNATGSDIMKRNGFFGPGGEVMVNNRSTAEIGGASKIIDVAVGPEGTWSIIDEKRQKVYTYDTEGNLLFIFGDKGNQFGNIASIEGIVYQGSKLLILDKTADSVTAFKRTEYGDVLINALANQNNRMYDKAIEDWTEILKRNNNYDAAYIGIGKALYREAKYEESMEYYKAAWDVANYSQSFKEIRKELVAKYIWLIPIVAIIVCVGIVKFFGYAGKVNQRTSLKVGRKTLKEEVLYGFHVVFRPFDGFWDLKHEQRGSVRGAIIFVVIAVITFYYQAVGQSYIFLGGYGYSNVFIQISSVCVPLFLWSISNWCLTTLFDGEGSFKDIFIATSYALVPIPLLVIPSTIATNFLAANEGQVVGLLNSLAFAWMGLLIFVGMMVTHDYSLAKNVMTMVGSIVGMAFIMFVAVLFSSLLMKIVSFVSQIFIEISYRM